MKNLILFTVLCCIAFSLTGQPSGYTISLRQFKSYRNLNEAELIKKPGFNTRSFINSSPKTLEINPTLKNSNVLKQKLDSIVAFSNDTIDEKRFFKYDNDGKLVEERIFAYYEGGGTFLREFSYNNMGKIIKHTWSKWDPNILNWSKQYQEEFIYVNIFLLLSYYYSEWDDLVQNWIVQYRYEYKYDNKYNLIRSDYINGEVIAKDAIFKYDSNGNVIYEERYTWDGAINYYTTYTYNSNDQIIEENTLHLNANNQSFDEEYKVIYSYDENKRMILNIILRKSRDGTGAFENRYKTEWIYNDLGDLEHYIFSLGNSNDYEWHEDINRTYSYNTDYLEKDLIYPFTITEELEYPFIISDYIVQGGIAERIFNHQIVNESVNGLVNESVSELGIIKYYYSEFNINEIKDCPVDTKYDDEPTNATSGPRFGQSITVMNSGNLEKIELTVWPSGSHPFIIIREWISDHYDHAFDGNIIAVSNNAINKPSTENYLQMSTFEFPSHPELLAGKKYVLEIVNGTPYVKIPGTYSGGQAYESANPSFERDMRFAVFICPGTTDIVNELVRQPQLKIYPNPSRGIVNIEIANENRKTAEVSIMNLTGSEVLRKEVSNATSFQIDLSKQINGLYLIKVCIGNQQYLDKIVIRK